MSTVTAGRKKAEAQNLAPYEREALSAAPAKLALLTGALFLGAGMIDVAGLPEAPATYAFMSGLATGAVTHLGISLARPKFRGSPFMKTVSLLSSWSSTATLGAVTLLFGDAALQSADPWLAFGMGALTAGACAVKSRIALRPRAMGAESPASSNQEGKPLSAHDRYMGAVHEAGHALTLGLLPAAWREGAFVRLKDSKNVFTHVPRDDGSWALAPFRRWEMLMLLAGPVVTDKIFGGAMEGGASDMRDWRHRAMSVMTAERTEGWALAPETELEVASNHRLLKELENDQVAALETFFELNAGLHHRLVEHILANDGAEPEALNHFLDEVVSSVEIERALGM
jgi:hypothetical protein